MYILLTSDFNRIVIMSILHFTTFIYNVESIGFLKIVYVQAVHVYENMFS